jgi:hypothetical protein
MLLPVIDWKGLWDNRIVRVASISLAALLGTAGIGVGGYYLWPEPKPKPPPPVASSSVGDTITYMASTDFSRLPKDKRLAWVEAQMRKFAEMSDEEFLKYWYETDRATRDQIRENMRTVMRERAQQHVQDYFKVPKADREAFLDQRIDEIHQWEPRVSRMFGRPGQRGPTSRPAFGRGGGDPNRFAEFRNRQFAARENQIIQESSRFMTGQSADQRGKSLAYFSALGRRRAERGDIRSPFVRRPPVTSRPR